MNAWYQKAFEGLAPKELMGMRGDQKNTILIYQMPKLPYGSIHSKGNISYAYQLGIPRPANTERPT